MNKVFFNVELRDKKKYTLVAKDVFTNFIRQVLKEEIRYKAINSYPHIGRKNSTVFRHNIVMCI